jgi:hypothetical protein
MFLLKGERGGEREKDVHSLAQVLGVSREIPLKLKNEVGF